MKEKITWSIDKEVIKEVKHRAIDEGSSTSALVEKAIRKYLK